MKARRYLEALGRAFGHRFDLEYADVGVEFPSTSTAPPFCPRCANWSSRLDAVLFGAVGGPKWDDPVGFG